MLSTLVAALRRVVLALQLVLLVGPGPRPRHDDRGQATAEYALVVLGAATVAMLLISWATATGKVSTLLNKVVDSVAARIA